MKAVSERQVAKIDTAHGTDEQRQEREEKKKERQTVFKYFTAVTSMKFNLLVFYSAVR